MAIFKREQKENIEGQWKKKYTLHSIRWWIMTLTWVEWRLIDEKESCVGMGLSSSMITEE